MERLLVVGPGRLGLALGYALWHADADVSLTYCGRRPDPPAHPLFIQGIAEYRFGLERPEPDTTAVFLTVPDHVLPEMAHALAGHGEAPTGCAAFHCSGALSADVLAPLHARGYSVGSCHPLQAVAHPLTGADRLPGSWFAISGERTAVAVARRLVAALDGRPLSVPVGGRPLYHAAGVVASNHLAALLGVAGRLLVHGGVAEEDALAALLPLIRGTLANVEEMGLGPAIAGPVERGDAETVALHLRSMAPREREVYAVLGSELVALASAYGLDEDVAATMNELFARERRGE